MPVGEITRDAAVTTDTSEGLAAIKAPGCAAAVWQRRPVPGVLDWLDQLDPAHLPRTRVILRPEGLRAAVLQACDAAGLPAEKHRDDFADDVARLGKEFAGLMAAQWLRLRLDVVTTNACRKFHVDAVTARLVCTYRGTGTQYGITRDGEAPEHVTTVPTGAPILLRGTLWPVNPAAGLKHRSPPIEGSGETRLVLVLDPVDGPEEDI